MHTSSGLSTRNGGVTLAAGMSMAVHAWARSGRIYRGAGAWPRCGPPRQLPQRKSLLPLLRSWKGIGTFESLPVIPATAVASFKASFPRLVSVN
jgi:hypothetical protein